MFHFVICFQFYFLNCKNCPFATCRIGNTLGVRFVPRSDSSQFYGNIHWQIYNIHIRKNWNPPNQLSFSIWIPLNSGSPTPPSSTKKSLGSSECGNRRSYHPSSRQHSTMWYSDNSSDLVSVRSADSRTWSSSCQDSWWCPWSWTRSHMWCRRSIWQNSRKQSRRYSYPQLHTGWSSSDSSQEVSSVVWWRERSSSV